MATIELKLSNKFLDEHSGMELESKIWNWLEKYGYTQGSLRDDDKAFIRIKIVAEAEEFFEE
jgi:hypothetical protein